ncbi:MAG TPA: hypothetical protein VMR28_01655 [Candidatus Saccharimonadales bacterium]|jgi:hypothetical protein|nr:hypothetical protein [Candidatus Saccharimonadales bacterium]
MANAIEKPQLVIPIDATHILGALDVARLDQEYFRHLEMTWLREHNTPFMVIVQSGFEKMIRHGGIDNGRASMMGCVLANHAVRLCVADELDGYSRASQNYRRNYDTDTIRLNQPGVSTKTRWDTKEVLDQVFGDEELTEAFMQIRHENARDAAAVTTGFFSLAEIPEVAYT